VPSSYVIVKSSYTESLLEAQGMNPGAAYVPPVDLERGEDFTITYDDGTVSASLTDERRSDLTNAQIEGQVNQQYPEAGLVRGEDYTIEDGELVMTPSGEERLAKNPKERFWDPEFVVPETTIGGVTFGGEKVEQSLRGAAHELRSLTKYTDSNAGKGTPWGRAGIEPNNWTVDFTVPGFGDVEVSNTGLTSTAEDVMHGVLLTPSMAVQTPVAAKEGFGWSGEGVVSKFEPAEGTTPWGRAGMEPKGGAPKDVTVDEFKSKTGGSVDERVSQAVGQYNEDPRKFIGQGVGTVLGTALFMGGAGAVSSRAGTASRFAIQPGEELLGYGGHALTKTATSARTADRLFPNKEPLIFSEEVVIGTGLAAKGKLAGAASSTKRVLHGESEIGAERGMTLNMERADRFWPSTAIEYEGEAEGGQGASTRTIEPEGVAIEAQLRSEQMEALGSDAPPEAFEEAYGTEPRDVSTDSASLAERTGGERAESAPTPDEGQPGATSEPLGSPLDFDPRSRRTPPEAGETGAEADEDWEYEPYSPSPGMREFIAETGQRQRDARIFGKMADEIGVDPEGMTGGGRVTPWSDLEYRTGPAAYGKTSAETGGGTKERAEKAQQPEVDLEDQGMANLDVRRDLVSEGEAENDLPAGYSKEYEARKERAEASEVQAEAERQAVKTEFGVGVGYKVNANSRADVRADQRAAPLERPRIDIGFETETETEQETRLDLETETEQRPIPQEFETPPREIEAEYEPEPVPEAESDPFGFDKKTKKQKKTETRRRSQGSDAGVENPFAIGYLGETYAGYAGIDVGSAFERTSRQDIESQGAFFGEALPSFTGEQASEFEATVDFLGGGGFEEDPFFGEEDGWV